MREVVGELRRIARILEAQEERRPTPNKRILDDNILIQNSLEKPNTVEIYVRGKRQRDQSNLERALFNVRDIRDREGALDVYYIDDSGAISLLDGGGNALQSWQVKIEDNPRTSSRRARVAQESDLR